MKKYPADVRVFTLLLLPLLFSLALTGCSGKSVKVTVYEGVIPEFSMSRLPSLTFPVGNNDRETSRVPAAFEISRTEVTYDLWKAVYDWATDPSRGAGVYAFANSGQPGGSAIDGFAGTGNQPVTEVSWRDCLVWCNAMTEWYNANTGRRFTPVYYADAAFSSLLRDSRDEHMMRTVNAKAGSVDNPYVKPGADGFRLHTSDEWELAARYVLDGNADGDILDEGEYYSGIFTSGSMANFLDAEATNRVAWYYDNSNGMSHPVGEKEPNAIGVYDMSGNVAEWCFDPNSAKPENRIVRGAAWSSPIRYLSLGAHFYTGYVTYDATNYLGFRFARTVK